MESNLPTEDGFYWVLEDLGIGQARCVCWVAISKGDIMTKHWPEGTVVIMSPLATYSEPIMADPSLHHKQFQPWDALRHIAWIGPLTVPPFEDFKSVR